MTRQRDTDGVLIQWSGDYQDPGEALKLWWAGKLRLGCAEAIFGNYRYHPCGKTPKHDTDARGFPTRCGIHCAAAKAKRKAKQDERHQAERAKWAKQGAVSEATSQIEPALRKIAEGHNDARGLAQEVIAALDKARNQ